MFKRSGMVLWLFTPCLLEPKHVLLLLPSSSNFISSQGFPEIEGFGILQTLTEKALL